MRKKPTRKRPYFKMESAMTAILRDASGKMHHGILFDPPLHSTKISGNFGPKLNGSVRSNRKSFEKTGPPFEVVLFSQSDRSEFWLNGSRPIQQVIFLPFTLVRRSV